MNLQQPQKSNLELLLEAYVEVTKLWGKGDPGHTQSRLWKTGDFLQKLIKLELEKK